MGFNKSSQRSVLFVWCPAATNNTNPARHGVAKAGKAPSLGIIREQCVDGIFLII